MVMLSDIYIQGSRMRVIDCGSFIQIRYFWAEEDEDEERILCMCFTHQESKGNSREEVCLYAAFVSKKVRLLLVEGRMH